MVLRHDCIEHFRKTCGASPYLGKQHLRCLIFAGATRGKMYEVPAVGFFCITKIIGYFSGLLRIGEFKSLAPLGERMTVYIKFIRKTKERFLILRHDNIKYFRKGSFPRAYLL